MGLAIDREDFQHHEYHAFSERLYDCLSALKHQIRQPEFGIGTQHIGAELENYIVNEHGNVLPINHELIQKADSSSYTVELNRFNIEINFDPLPLGPRAFSDLKEQMDVYEQKLQTIANFFDARIIPIGILPTLENHHLTPEYMSNFARYRALSKHLYEMRGEDFEVHIRGEDELLLRCDHVGAEGANTSFQFHLMVKPEEFSDIFNATQLITPLIVAVSANSPILLNHLLWDETRVALFKQSIDSRTRHNGNWRQPSRVSFGHGWVREDAYELFAETVALYPPIFPVLSEQDPLDAIKKSEIPKLEELSLHMGTTWPWNRPVYSASNNGHVRIEMRALPAGPSNIDMCANAAFATGLAYGLKHSIRDIISVIPFRFAEYNFYRAAQSGLDAHLIWTDPQKHQLIELPITDILYALLPIADQGLTDLGIHSHERDQMLGYIKARLDKRISGARWQRQVLKFYEKTHSRHEACTQMFQYYMEEQKSHAPIHEWAMPKCPMI